MKKFICKTKNNFEVYIIENNKHMEAHSSITEAMLEKALKKIIYTPTFWMGTVELDTFTGFDNCVETSEGDDIRYECRPGREIRSRLVYGRQPEETNLITIGLCTDDEDGLVTVFTAFPGQKAPKELEDPRLTEEERPEAEAFWATHALCAEEKEKEENMNKYFEIKKIMEAHNLHDEAQNNPHHVGTVWEHTALVVENAEAYNASDAVIEAAIWHDSGKPDVKKVNDKTGFDQFIGHADRSTEIYMTDGPADRYVAELIRLHDTKPSKQGKLKTLLEEHPAGFVADLLLLQLCDVLGQSEFQRAQKLEEIRAFADRLLSVATPEQAKGITEVISLLNAELAK